MVIGAPYIYRFIKTALDKLIGVICYIRGKVCRVAVGSYEHLVLFAAVLGRLIPESAVLFICQTFACHKLNNVLYLAAVMKLAFIKPLVIGDTVLCEIILH